jgi:hypothetical protein
MTPMLGGAILIGCLLVAVGVAGAKPSLSQQAGMILGLCGSLAVAGVVAARSSRESAVMDREERDRPARHEFAGVDDGPSTYIANMGLWADAMVELTEHAAVTPAAIESGVADELASASEDARELRELLNANVDVRLKVTALATIRSICTSWEADEARVEGLAASVDPEWHRRWRARSVVERLVRHGARPPEATPLPYRA